MGEIRARTADEVQERKKAILAACEELCSRFEYDEITLKEISQHTALSRTSMYSYYQRKEEVFLDLLKEKCREWAAAMEEAFLCREKLTQEDFCVIYSEILCRSELTLKLLSLNITAIEKNCSLDAVLSFRQAEEKIYTVLLGVFRKIFPAVSEEALSGLLTQITAYIYGLYPVTHLSPKLLEVWEHFGQPAPDPDMHAVCLQGITLLIDGFSRRYHEASRSN